ncbi:GNAT family N-acetyltransferase [uncultured Microbacterium sp.]|uniref:GNAT family N-acetyltransferase n=1 Tax=uncultured Microbacterium sp. TaxID=191216 RepID=UPI0025D725DB|nr:GNAT family N-acetyltransferase [uncultured Microbacterium sp.]
MAIVADHPVTVVVDIRVFDPVRDAHRVAAFYNEEGYGPIASGRAATAGILLDILAERAVELFIVAEQHGRIVGTLGYARMSGRRVAPDGQLFAVMFFVSPSLRAGFLVGRLFNDSFARFADLGARSLRVEVDPANRRAFPLYVRIGFRLVGDGRPDEDGYLELVNHLPGVAAALQPERSSVSGPSRYSAQTIREARRQTLTSGVGRDRTGEPTISYHLEIDGRPVSAVTHADTGEILSATVGGLRIDGRWTGAEPLAGDSPAEVVHPLPGGFSAVLQTADGAIRIEHPRHLGPLALDPFPVDRRIPAGVRRPAARMVTSTVEDQRWISTDGEIVRTVEFARGGLDVAVTHRDGERIAIFPWSGFRAATLTVTSPSADSPASAHYIRGVWPRDLTDFEAAAEDVCEAQGTQAVWIETSTGLELRIEVHSPGQWRIEGPHLARVCAEASLNYRYVPRNGSVSAIAARSRNDARRGRESTDLPDTRCHARDSPVRVEAAARCSAADAVAVDVNEGVMEWRLGGVSIVEAAPPDRRLGPLSGFRSSMWFALQPSRYDPDAGAVWAPPDPRLSYGTGIDEWWVEPCSGSHLILHARARRAGSKTSELVVYLAVPDAEAELWDPEQGWYAESASGSTWRAWTTRCRMHTPHGVMEIEPMVGLFPEILVRRGSFGVVLAMHSQTDLLGVEAAWHVRFIARASASSSPADG